jgi:hypothetical protein
MGRLSTEEVERKTFLTADTLRVVLAAGTGVLADSYSLLVTDNGKALEIFSYNVQFWL